MFRRNKAAEAQAAAETATEEKAEFDPTAGPWDVGDIDLEDGIERVDLGGLLLAPSPGHELRLQVDEATQQVQSVLIAGPEGAVELRPFAAPRNGDLWGEIMPQIAEDITRRGGTVEEREGAHGIELVGSVPVQVADDKTAEQPSRIVGVNGPRWLLRATFLGSPATHPDEATDWEAVLGSVIVRRGSQAMPAGDPLPLTLPPQARKQA